MASRVTVLNWRRQLWGWLTWHRKGAGECHAGCCLLASTKEHVFPSSSIVIFKWELTSFDHMNHMPHLWPLYVVIYICHGILGNSDNRICLSVTCLSISKNTWVYTDDNWNSNSLCSCFIHLPIGAVKAKNSVMQFFGTKNPSSSKSFITACGTRKWLRGCRLKPSKTTALRYGIFCKSSFSLTLTLYLQWPLWSQWITFLECGDTSPNIPRSIAKLWM